MCNSISCLHKGWENCGGPPSFWKEELWVDHNTWLWNPSTNLGGRVFPRALAMMGYIIGVSGVWISVAANQLSSTLSKPFFLMQVKKNPRCDWVGRKKKKSICANCVLEGPLWPLLFFLMTIILWGQIIFSLLPSLSSFPLFYTGWIWK